MMKDSDKRKAEARRRYHESLKRLYKALLTAADANTAVIVSYNDCCEAQTGDLAFHWADLLDIDPSSYSRVSQWRRVVEANVIGLGDLDS